MSNLQKLNKLLEGSNRDYSRLKHLEDKFSIDIQKVDEVVWKWMESTFGYAEAAYEITERRGFPTIVVGLSYQQPTEDGKKQAKAGNQESAEELLSALQAEGYKSFKVETVTSRYFELRMENFE